MSAADHRGDRSCEPRLPGVFGVPGVALSLRWRLRRNYTGLTPSIGTFARDLLPRGERGMGLMAGRTPTSQSTCAVSNRSARAAWSRTCAGGLANPGGTRRGTWGTHPATLRNRTARTVETTAKTQQPIIQGQGDFADYASYTTGISQLSRRHILRKFRPPCSLERWRGDQVHRVMLLVSPQGRTCSSRDTALCWGDGDLE